jgi:DNA-binding response OmpR family regulator
VENKDYTLLVVDDVAENRDVLSRRLQRRAFNVLTAECGERALEIVRGQAVDLVLLDIMMPGMDGVQVLKELRRTWNQNEMPVIMQTAKSGSDDVVEALEAGANDYVTKPIDFPVVLARVQTHLRGKAQAAPPEPRRSELGPGVVIDGKYRLDERIGEGTFGVVYRGKHLDLDVDVAIKILLKNVTASGEAVERFRQEGVSAYRVRHPNAVAVSDFGVTAGGVAYLVMELLEGISLAEEIETRGALSPHRANEILQPICDVLAQAHEAGIVHRDIKPENVFLHRSPRGEVVKVLDFGISKLVGDNIVRQNLTAEGFVLGTPAYMAPERLVDEPYDGRSDVYSLGIMLFYMLSGRLPFVAESGDAMALLMMHLNEPFPSLCGLDPALPRSLEELVERATDKTPGRRPEAATLGREFAAAVAELPPDVGSRARGPLEHVDPGAPTVATRVTAAVPAKAAAGLLGRVLRKLKKG